MILELAAGSLLAADFFYHRWWGDQPKKFASFADSIDIPQTEEGAVEPCVYGKVRVTRPILAWIGTPEATAGIGTLTGKTLYSASMFFKIGVPFANGDSTNRIHRIWQGDTEYIDIPLLTDWSPYATTTRLDDLDGDGGFEDENRHLSFVSYLMKTGDGDVTSHSRGCVEFLNGKQTQSTVDDAYPYTARTRAGYRMSSEAFASGGSGAADDMRGRTPGYRGIMSVCLYRLDADTGSGITQGGFTWGLTPQLGAFSFEVSSYKSDGDYPAVGVLARLGDDSNPINVFYDIWTDPRKLGLSPSTLDMESLINAAATCYQEDLGCSFCFDQRMPARDMLAEVMRHVDGVYFEDTKTGKVKINLIRPNYDYRSLFEINEANCSDLANLAIGGLTDVPNKVDVLYKDRSLGYIDATASDQNLANAVGQDGVERKEQRAYSGCTYKAQAAAFASRDLAFLSQPTIKFRALLDRSAIVLEPGQAVRVNYPKYGITGLVFRVAGPPYHGKLTDGQIAIDMISDSSYQFRSFPPAPPVPHPDIGRGIVLGFGMR